MSKMGLKLTQIGNNMIITDNGTEGAMFRASDETRMNYNYPKPFRTSGTIDEAIAMPTTRREFIRMVDKIEVYKSTVTDLIIRTYGGIKC